MTRKLYPLWLILTFFLTAATPDLNLQLHTERTPAPPGFYLIDASIGWEMYRKDYKEGNPDFVQVIRLDEGAGIELITGDIAKSGKDRGSYGGDNPKFFSRSLEDYWWDISSKNTNALCVTNGSFFYLPEHPTKLAFPLKVDNKIITDGFGIDTYPWQKVILELWDGKAEIRQLTRWNLHTSNAPGIIGGLSEDANKKAKNFTGRTFIGIDDRDSDGVNETLLIFNTLTARQEDAADTLYSFGADKVMMLDGGGSTQLLCKGEGIVSSERLIPQVLAVIRGEGPLYSGRILNPPEHPILVDGEKISMEITVENIGAESWRPDNGYLLIDYGPITSKQKIPLDMIILPGEKVNITWNFEPGNSRGDLNSNFYLIQGTQKYHIGPADIPISLLPRKSGIKLKEFAKNLDIFQKTKTTEVSVKTLEPVATPNKPAIHSISSEVAISEGDINKSGPSSSVFLIPLTIIIISGVIIVGIKRRNSQY
jgi:hypothetical protein